jgi:hypothetical protein
VTAACTDEPRYLAKCCPEGQYTMIYPQCTSVAAVLAWVHLGNGHVPGKCIAPDCGMLIVFSSVVRHTAIHCSGCRWKVAAAVHGLLNFFVMLLNSIASRV